MNKNDFKNPLIQSGIILLFLFLLISIVANSDANGLFGSFSALLSGLFSAIVFIIGLCLAIIVSITIIIGLFIAAVSIHSVDKARNFYNQLKMSLCSLYRKIRGSIPLATDSAHTVTGTTTSHPHPAATIAGLDDETLKQITSLERSVTHLQQAVNALRTDAHKTAEQLHALHDQLTVLQEQNQFDDKLRDLVQAQETLSTELSELASTINANDRQFKTLETVLDQDREYVRAELSELNKKTSVPDFISGILSYIDKEEDRDKVTQKAEEAVARGMTYSQTDDFFKSSLPAAIYKILAAHPRLTKDFLRSIKRKLS